MLIHNQKAIDRINWVQVLVVAVAANLLGGLVFTLIEDLAPSWIVYPLLLIIGLALLLRVPTTGALFLSGSAAIFLLIHLPFTLFTAFAAHAGMAASAPRKQTFNTMKSYP